MYDSEENAKYDLESKNDLAASIAALYKIHPGSAHALWESIPDIQIGNHDPLIESVNDILATNYGITVDDLMQFSNHDAPNMGEEDDE